GSYQLLADLRLKLVHEGAEAEVTGYTRVLDLADALARLSYTRGEVRFTREFFASAPDKVLVLRLTADQPGALAFALDWSGPERATARAFGSDGLRLDGQLNDGRGGASGVRFAARLRALAPGAQIVQEGATLHVRNAREALV